MEVLEDASLIMNSSLRLIRLAWLLYATHHPRRVPGLSLVLKIHSDDVSLNASELTYMEELVQARIPLRDVVSAVVHTRYADSPGVRVDCFDWGAMVSVAGGTTVFCEPGRWSAEYAVASLVHNESVDVVAHVLSDDSVGVVYPGYGLVWVHISTVPGMPNTGDAKDGVVDIGGSAALSSLTLHLGYHHHGVFQSHVRKRSPQLLPFFLCSTLTASELSRAEISREMLPLILQMCPQMQTLTLRSSAVDSLGPLLSAYTCSRGCRVSALTFSDVAVSDQSFAAIFDALLQPRHPLTIVLRELHLDLSTHSKQHEAGDFERLVNAREAPRLRLQRVTLRASMAHRLPQEMRARLKRLTLRLLSDPPRAITLATLSVLRVKGPQVYNEGVARTVLWFVRGSQTLSLGWAA